ncbi:FAD dependent oxidoreductase [Stereum hirsutum FP-91666 SS1]|uniref:FAD dependent oxidoreductase n=1 Tax=Stereum hirsutum (strain FP-91666) TaxID=721885 RepID=UPI000440F1E1|nr:FAD dependent oxidoreductase [Stereum hirsutum FP-91666 SS1]EIM92347.1 FAD dependent oxidoreductase [Stereum hirsutum FP-91666 SS1]
MSSFPQSFKSTVSHWQATNRGPKSLFNYGVEDALPADADFVIIGAGMTGASLAYQLTRPGAAGEGKSVVLLEAKDIASGATGRNGGHLAPYTFGAYTRLVTPLTEGGAGVSSEEAVKIIRMERDNYAIAREIVEKEGLDVDLWCGEALDVFLTEEEKLAERAAWDKGLAALQSCGFQSDDDQTRWIEDAQEVQRLSRTPAVGGATRKAGSVHPHKLCTELVRLALQSKSSNFKYFSWTPVESFESLNEGEWLVKAHSKGQIRAKNVILCSNAHTGHIFEPFKAHITPARGHASLITVPTSFSGTKHISNSLMFSGPYLMFTPSSGWVLGVGWGGLVNEGIVKKEEVGNFLGAVDDSVVLEPIRDYLKDYCKDTFQGWGEEAEGEGLSRVWTGIMGYSRDLLPLIGPVPGKKNLWAAVAFHGHGMSRILSCTQSLAKQILDQGVWDERLPRSFEITEERMERAKTAPPLAGERVIKEVVEVSSS